MADYGIPREMIPDDVPERLDFVIVYSCEVHECNLHDVMEMLREHGDAEIISCDVAYVNDKEEEEKKKEDRDDEGRDYGVGV